MEPGYRSATADDDSYVADGSADTTTVQSSKRKASSAPDGAPSAKRSKRKTAGRSTLNAHSPRKGSEKPAPANDVQECPVCGSDKHVPEHWGFLHSRFRVDVSYREHS
ncbi:hypothetical protein E4U26_002015 [Claviceps purpurea]|nr:hypothetical protein E4U26_002015 [Claviceps purpurea]